MSPRPRKSNQPPSERTKLRNVALFKDEDEPTGQTSPQTLPMTQIVTSSTQPRRYFDPDKLEQLTQSVREHGILEPLLVRPLPDNKYELVAGERRYRAAEAAGLKEVPVIIKELTDKDALQLALIENLQREDLNPVEETEGILQLLALQLDSTSEEARQLLYQMKNAIEKSKKSESDSRDNVIPNLNSESEKNIQSVFERLGKNWYSFTCNRLPLINLPEDILEALQSGQIEYTKAKAIASVKDEELRKQLLEDAIANSLSLSQIKEKVRAKSSSPLLKPTKEKEELRSRVDNTYKQLKKSKQLWQDPKKRKKLESLLSQLEKLIESESSSVVNKATLDPIFEASNEPQSNEPTEQEFELLPEESDTGTEEAGLTDDELGELLKVSNIIIRDCRVKGKKPPAGLAKKLVEWEVRGERWVRKF